MSDNLPFGDSFTGGGAGGNRTYFKPEDLVDSTVLMIEVKGAGQEPNPFYDDKKPQEGKNTPTRLAIKATVTAFNSPEALEAGQGKEFPNVVINQGYLASDLEGSVGKVEVYKLHQQPAKQRGYKPAWVWRGVEGKLVEQVKAYYVQREAAIAAAVADDDAPAFLKG